MFKFIRSYIPCIDQLLHIPRLLNWLIFSVLLFALLAVLSITQLPVVLYKLTLISLAAVIGYWLDRSLFPYARPDGYLKLRWKGRPEGDDYKVDHPVVDGYQRVFATAMLRRAIIVAAVMLAVAMGL